MQIINTLQTSEKADIKFFSSNVSAGFPSPCEPHLESSLNLHDHLVKRPSSTFFTRVSGDSMIEFGINDKAILVVDKSLTAKNNDIVIATIDNEMLVKQIKFNPNKLISGNPNYPNIQLNNSGNVEIWGVVTAAINVFR